MSADTKEETNGRDVHGTYRRAAAEGAARIGTKLGRTARGNVTAINPAEERTRCSASGLQ